MGIKTFLFGLFVFALVLMFSSCGVRQPAGTELKGVCIHPGVMGGMSFNIPPNAYFNDHNQLVVTQDDGTQYILTGAICVMIRGGLSQ